jgi:UDP-N-acetylmuramoyl-tripeptide--D-alanyl-D-alanine ligase
VGPDVELDGASFDSRTVSPGELFVAIVAERDGHEFVGAALAAGAGAALVGHGRWSPEGSASADAPSTVVEVDDPGSALMELAGWARSRFPDRVVGVTGSVGKTSTKDLLAAALSASLRVAASERSFNNEQGLPVTVLGAADDTEVLVLEMGMRGFGEIARLCAVGRPTVGVVTAVGHSHTERVGGLVGVARAKAELVRALPAHGTAVLNADDPLVLAMRTEAPGDVLTYGVAAGADVQVCDLVLDEFAHPRFVARTAWGRFEVELAVSGAHMASNAAAALAVAGSLGVPLDDAAAAMATSGLSAMRMEVGRTPSGAVVVNDAYNANPTSMRAALDSLAAMQAVRRIAVLGRMAEIEHPETAHREMADHAAALGIEVIAVGTDMYGISPVDDPVSALGRLGPGDAVLVKASRMAALDTIARLLTELSA